MMKIKAIADRVVVRVDNDEKRDPAGYAFGRVIYVGPGREDWFLDLKSGARERVYTSNPLSVGDRVIFTAYAATKGIKDPEGFDICILDQYQILGKIEE